MNRDSKCRLWALVGPTAVAACLVAACVPASVGAAQKPSTNPNPKPLWNAYPLDEDAASGGATTTQKATPTTTRPQTPSDQAPIPTRTTVREQAGAGPPWLLIILAGAGGVLFVIVLLRLQAQMESRRPDEPLTPPADDWPLLTPTPATAGNEKPRPGSAAQPAKAGPAFEVADLISVPVRRFEHKAPVEHGADVPHRGRFERGPEVPDRGRFDRGAPAEETPQARAAAARHGPICQVRWSPRATRFYAVTTDEDGVEHPLARSPRVDWQGHAPPPEDSREAQSALRLLAKDLRENGWRPMRAKGVDFETQQWYARRFRFPTVAGEDERAPWRRLDDPETAERRRA